MTDSATLKLTVVTPTYEKHYRQFAAMIGSIKDHCIDLTSVIFYVIVEEVNRDLFESLLRQQGISYRLISTEDVLAELGTEETPSEFLKRVGKFTFQSIKKFGGLRRSQTAWSLVLDSEGLFAKRFSFMQLLSDYAEQKYVFYTRTAPRGPLWQNSTAFAVTRYCGEILNTPSGDRWYMEYFHWFYETELVLDLLETAISPAFRTEISSRSGRPGDVFENILYYLYLEKYHHKKYAFYDFQELLTSLIPGTLSSRFVLSELPFSLFGNEYLLNIVRPEEVTQLAPLFERFRLPFVRLEPPFFSPDYVTELTKLPSFVATISSHHLMWMRKKIAVCISGEFRHVLHRVPEHQVRHMRGFLAGVDCDVFIHGWSNTSEPLIIDQLQPKRYRFEAKPSFAELESRIKTREPNIKPGRDAGSLAMFYGIQSAFQLVEESLEDYDFVVRIRPDMYFDGSLKEILVAISDVGDFQEDTIYFPKHFHSKGINDQFAIGPTRQMAVYCKTFEYIERNMDALFFNPESVLLRNLLERRVGIAVLEMRYALMRQEPFRAPIIAHHMHDQEHVWWSRTDILPSFQDLTAYFQDKLRSIDGIMRGKLANVVFVEAKQRGGEGGCVLLRCAVIDNDPSWAASVFLDRVGPMSIMPLLIRDGMVETRSHVPRRTIFVFRTGDVLTVSQWSQDGARWCREVIEVPMSRVTVGRSPYPRKTKRAFAWRAMKERLESTKVLGPAFVRMQRALPKREEPEVSSDRRS